MNTKHTIPKLFAACMALCLPLSAATFGDFTYTDNGISITITGYLSSETGAVVIPATIIGKPVISIGRNAFYTKSRMSSVKIPSSVTSIGRSAFFGCSGLTSVTIPSSVTIIEFGVFGTCSGLTSVTIPSSVISIGNYAFSSCPGLTTARFLGNAPFMGIDVFKSAAPGFQINYITGKTGFTTPTWLGYPCVSGVAATPEINVQQPIGSSLVDGMAKKSFGTVVVGQSGTPKTFTLKNTGTGNLTGLAVSVDGTNAGDFIITPLAKTKLVPGASTTFKVTFKPTATGTRSAVISIQSNDADENPFDIKLVGTGAL